MKQEIIDLANYRMEQARQSRMDAGLLLRNKSYKAAMNRAYYAIFYAARALLALKELDSSKHSGVIALFNKEFVKPGPLTKEESEIIMGAFRLRIKGDYEDYSQISEDRVMEMMEKADHFIAEADRVLKEMIKKA